MDPLSFVAAFAMSHEPKPEPRTAPTPAPAAVAELDPWGAVLRDLVPTPAKTTRVRHECPTVADCDCGCTTGGACPCKPATRPEPPKAETPATPPAPIAPAAEPKAATSLAPAGFTPVTWELADSQGVLWRHADKRHLEAWVAHRNSSFRHTARWYYPVTPQGGCAGGRCGR